MDENMLNDFLIGKWKWKWKWIQYVKKDNLNLDLQFVCVVQAFIILTRIS